MPVSAAGAGEALQLPAALPAYFEDVSEQAPEDGHLAMCLLLGGILDRQPALATALATPTAEALRARLREAGRQAGLDIATTGVLLNPNGVRLSGWDALLLADMVDDAPETSACPMLAERIFGNGAPAIGPDPTDALPACPALGLVDGESLRLTVAFEPGKAELDEIAETTIEAARACIAEDIPHAVTIEGYASRNGSPAANVGLSNARAVAVRQALEGLGDPLNLRLRATGFGMTGLFGPDADANRIATITITRAPDDPLGPPPQGLATAAVTTYLDRDTRTCRPRGHRPVARAEALLTFLTSNYGREMMAQLQAPDMVVLLHNQIGPSGENDPAFARSLQRAAGRSGPCGNTGEPHVGYLYERTGAPYASGEPSDGPDRTDYFVLPPKITWIYPVSDSRDGPDLEAFATVADIYRLRSENGVDLQRLADPSETRYRRTWLNLVDVFRYDAPVPVTEVLNALRDANAGTGWVNLSSGWE